MLFDEINNIADGFKCLDCPIGYFNIKFVLNGNSKVDQIKRA